MAAESLDIHIPDVNRPLARVTAGPARRVYHSTTTAVGLSLLSAARQHDGEESRAARAADMRWQDHLATHGIAIGMRGTQQVTVAVIPATRRTCPFITSGGVSQPFEATFPPLLAGVLLRDGAFVRAILHCIDPARIGAPGLSVLDTTACLTHFPYGNVHPNGAICWGTIRHDGIASLATFLDLFFNSGFNADLYNGNVCGLGGGSIRAAATAAAGGILPGPRAWEGNIPGALGTLIGG